MRPDSLLALVAIGGTLRLRGFVYGNVQTQLFPCLAGGGKYLLDRCHFLFRGYCFTAPDGHSTRSCRKASAGRCRSIGGWYAIPGGLRCCGYGAHDPAWRGDSTHHSRRVSWAYQRGQCNVCHWWSYVGTVRVRCCGWRSEPTVLRRERRSSLYPCDSRYCCLRSWIVARKNQVTQTGYSAGPRSVRFSSRQ